MIRYYPRRPVKSFQDLEIYQKLLASGVVVVKSVNNCQTTPLLEELIKNPLIKYVVDLPRLIAKAHSIRFSEFAEAQKTLELAMLNCNLAVVHLELFRDLCSSDCAEFSTDIVVESIKSYLTVRYKILHLQKTWQKFKEGV